ncbi:MAG TPA: L,D-transpeptidase [Candidatus Kapabacteria bacterium]|nr:L,D-transpeptidase [Candidatus Kapabacteria bacterium]HPO62165.1 L,D-transpeptidase [Candidatus Kapabacteria bacterium]
MFKILFEYFLKISILIFIIIFAVSCDKKTSQADMANAAILDLLELVRVQDSIDMEKKIAAENFFPLIKYSKIKINSSKELSDILKRFIKEEKGFDKSKILKTLNRKELRFMYIGDSILIPDTIIDDIKAYSVFPQFYYEARHIPKIIMVSNRMQCYACYEYGQLVRFAAANTGKEKTPTFPGRYSLVWKQRLRISSLDETWEMPFTFNIHNEAGSAFHQFSMPGRPVSHSCIRQFLDDAEWLYSWGDRAKRDSTGWIPHSGTTVIIIDYFDFNRKRYGDWIDLTSNKKILELPKKPMEVEEALIPIIQIPKTSRGVLRNRDRYVYAEDTLRARGVIRENVKLTPSIDFNKQRKQKALEKQKKEAEKLKKMHSDS